MIKLTIGMAHFQDFYGVHLTIQSLRLYHQLNWSEIEFLIIDNSPGSADSHMMQQFIKGLGGSINARIVDFDGVIGTTQSREAIFKEARGVGVIVCDCHVQFGNTLPGVSAIQKTIDWLNDPKNTGFYSGVLRMDNLLDMSTHLTRTWGEYMYGQWAMAWVRPSSRNTIIQAIKTKEGDNEFARFHKFDMVNGKSLGLDPTLDTNHGWCQHEQYLTRMGLVPYLPAPTDEPFAIPAHGLGMFACRKDSWVGFNEHFREFGGEEYYIQDKFRAMGREVKCLPWVHWVHRWQRVGGGKYPMSRSVQLRNNILGRLEVASILNKTPELQDVIDHYTLEMNMPVDVVKRILANPIEYVPSRQANIQPSAKKTCSKDKCDGSCKTNPASDVPGKSNLGHPIPSEQAIATMDLDGVCTWLEQQPRDLDQHGSVIKWAAAQCESATEITKRRESSIFLLSRVKQHLMTHSEEADTIYDVAKKVMVSGNEKRRITWDLHVGSLDTMPPSIKATDMLFIDTRHNAARASAELKAYGKNVRKFIIYHDTATNANGLVGDDKKAGILIAMREFVYSNPEWFCMYHVNKQYGLTILCRDPALRPKVAVKPWPIGCGAGSELKRLLSRLGIVVEAGCSCEARAQAMDRNGIEWCDGNKELIAKWLREEASARQKDPSDETLNQLVRIAIRIAKTKRLLGYCREEPAVAEFGELPNLELAGL